MGLRLKLGLYVLLSVLAVLTVVGYVRIEAERSIYQDEMVKRGRTLLRGLAIPCGVAMANNEIPALDNYIHSFAEEAASLDLKYLAALDYWGRVLAHTAEAEYGKSYDDAFTLQALVSREPISRTTTLAGEPVLEVAVPVHSGLRWGTLKAGFALTPMELRLAANRERTILTSLAVSLVVALIAFAVLSMLVIRPVLSMEEMARRFGGGDLRARVSIDTGDEIGCLAVQLNAMARQLETYTSSLEKLVHERTAELVGANAKLLDVNAQLDKLAKTDGLTGLFNRRYFMDKLGFEVRRSDRNKRSFSLVLLDVDHFKQFNDTHGHPAGDELLQRLATLVELNLRSIDVVARYGGEEFVVLLYDTGPDEGTRVAEKLRRAVAEQSFAHAETQPGGRLTISMGVAFYPQDAKDGASLVEAADRALYGSKAAGRNRATRFDALPQT